MKYRLIAALALTLFSITTMATTDLPAPRASEQPIDQIVATVNDRIITQSDINTIYHRALKQIARSHRPVPSKSVIKNEILNQLIYKNIQLSLANRYGLKITEKQIDGAIKSIAKQNHVSTAQLKAKVKKDGYTYPEYRKEIRDQILITTIQHQILGPKLNVTKAEVQQFLEKYKSQAKYAATYHVIDMRVPLPVEASATQTQEAKIKAVKIIKKLRNGTSAYKIAGILVTDLGWKTLANLPDLFASKLAQAKRHSVVGPILAQNGYHILEVTGIKHPKKRMPSELQVKQVLLQQKLNEKLEPWLNKLRKQSSVKILTPQ